MNTAKNVGKTGGFLKHFFFFNHNIFLDNTVHSAQASHQKGGSTAMARLGARLQRKSTTCERVHQSRGLM